jgi:hypothetical protein
VVSPSPDPSIHDASTEEETESGLGNATDEERQGSELVIGIIDETESGINNTPPEEQVEAVTILPRPIATKW